MKTYLCRPSSLLSDALRLANEVRATMGLAEQAVREAAGNTNYQCLMDAESEARVALADDQPGLFQ